MSVLAHLLDAIVSIVPAGTAVTIVTFIFKLAMHAIDDRDRWNRFLSIAVPVLILVFVVTGIATWWLIWDGGVQVVLQLVGHTVAPATRHRT